MRVLLQRVSEAAVRIDGAIVGAIGPGLLALVCAVEGDGQAEAERLAGKTAKLRIFQEEDGKMNRSVADIGGSVLVVSQFTHAADHAKGQPAELHRRRRAGSGERAGRAFRLLPESGGPAGRNRAVRGRHEGFPDQ